MNSPAHPLPLKAVVFDLDGTLIDSLGDLADSMNLTLEHYGHPVHPEASYKIFVGDGVENLVRRALPQGGDYDVNTITEVAARMREIYAKRWTLRTRPYDGIPEMLSALNERGIPLAILSNKPDGPALEVVRQLLGDWDFKIVQGARANVPIKPDPTSALDVARRLGLPPEEIHYLGDTDTDMKTAKGAGMIAVGVTWGFRDEPELREHGADLILNHPREFLSSFEKS
jgi:phosphoglycolate phosphatase